MVWPLLSGERGHYELEKAVEMGLTGAAVDAAVNPYIQTMENFANPGYMIPEQVWDSGTLAGQSTGSATPLGWAHGEYIKLLRSRADRLVFDRIDY
jgi:glucoamylase